MKKRLYIVTTARLVDLSTVNADIKPYAGIDGLVGSGGFKTNYGDVYFRKDNKAGNFNLGLNVHDQFDLEMGYELGKKMKNSFILLPGDALPPGSDYKVLN